ncbi:hypothetical protein [Streptomyces lavendulocolor]|uniref:hypothetical protein n=1 Tax=Streptomyces lavendulocolor TaxID=67316 RepID=UPI003C2BE800
MEQDADVVILLNRPDAYEKESERAGDTDLTIAKHLPGEVFGAIVATCVVINETAVRCPAVPRRRSGRSKGACRSAQTARSASPSGRRRPAAHRPHPHPAVLTHPSQGPADARPPGPSAYTVQSQRRRRGTAGGVAAAGCRVTLGRGG